MQNPKETIKVENLSTGYFRKNGVNVVTGNITASLYSGELTCLLGPNGAGKSTLLRTLSAFQPPVEGEILIEGMPLKSIAPSTLSKTIGVVLTDKPQLEHMTVEELVSLGRSPYTGFWGKLSEEDEHIVNESIRMTGIGCLRDRVVQTLSDGERQKVMIAKALAQETPIIFLDEPTAFLDYPSKIELMMLLRRLARERGKTVFLSTHDLEIALQIADKAWLLDKRFGVSVGSPAELAQSGKIGQYFNREGVVFDPELRQFKICV